jgi:hypothetical protein
MNTERDYPAEMAKIWATQADDDAERLAGYYKYNTDALWFQYNRRCFGSFTTTLDGSAYQRDRFFRAWKIAMARKETV